MLNNIEDIKNWLSLMNIDNYNIIKEKNNYMINANSINLSEKKLHEIPVQFNKVNFFNCSNNQLTSLKGCPLDTENFICNDNTLTSLEYSPNSKFINCSNNNISNLQYLSKKTSVLICTNNKIKNLFDIKSHNDLIEISCDNNLLTSLKNCPVNLEYLNFSNNLLKSLYGLHNLKKTVDQLLLDHNKIKNLKYLPNNTNILELNNNNIDSLEDLIDKEVQHIELKNNDLKIQDFFKLDLYKINYISSDLFNDKYDILSIYNSLKENNNLLSIYNSNDVNKLKKNKINKI